jgi:hypothetical protein
MLRCSCGLIFSRPPDGHVLYQPLDLGRDYSMDIRRPAPAANSRISKEVSRAQSMEYSAQVRQQLAGDMGGITGTPNCQGWLLKESKGMLMSKWQKRYFALYGQRLLYWVEEDDFRCLFLPNIHLPGFIWKFLDRGPQIPPSVRTRSSRLQPASIRSHHPRSPSHAQTHMRARTSTIRGTLCFDPRTPTAPVMFLRRENQSCTCAGSAVVATSLSASRHAHARPMRLQQSGNDY